MLKQITSLQLKKIKPGTVILDDSMKETLLNPNLNC